MKNLIALVLVAAALAGIAVVSHGYFEELRQGGPSGANLVANSALEHPQPKDVKKPYGWQNGRWGDNSAKFEYLVNGGINDSRAVKVKLSRYRSGDAKWYFDYIPVRGGYRYRFSDWYLCDRNSTISLYTDTKNEILSQTVPPAANWSKAEVTFVMPTDATRATVFHLISENGNLTTDNHMLAPVGFEESDRGFKNALVSLVFIDGEPLQYWSAAKTVGMEPYYWKATFYVKPEFAADNDRYYAGARYIDRINWFGHEIGLDGFSIAAQNEKNRQNLLAAKTRWQVTGSVACPVGINTSINLSEYDSNLNLENGPNGVFDFNKYMLLSVDGDALDAQNFKKTLDEATRKKNWLVIRYRGAPPKEHLDLLLARGINPIPVSEALQEVLPQLPD